MEQLSPQDPSQPSLQVVKKPWYRSKKWLAIGLVGALLVISIPLTILQLNDRNEVATENTPSTQGESKAVTPTETVTVASSPVDEIKKSINDDPALAKFVSGDTSRLGNLWWISEDNWSINVPGASGLELDIPVAEKDYAVKTVTTPESKKFHSIIADIMQKDGYILNTANSSKNEQDDQYYDYVQAYESPSDYCVATSDPDISSYGEPMPMSRILRVQCVSVDEFEKAYSQQIPFLKGNGDRKAVISNIKVIDGDKARMSINWRRTGAALMMYKDGDVWKTVTVAQGLGDCKELEEKNIPRAYWVTCYKDGKEVPGAF